MPFRKQLMFALFVLGAAKVATGAGNVFVLPNASSTSGQVTVLGTDNFFVQTSFAASPSTFSVLAVPAGNKYYAISRAPNDTVRIYEGSGFTQKAGALSLGQAEAAAMTPDGRRLLVAAGSLHIIDVTTDAVIATLAVGNTPTDIAVSHDSSRAFVLSPASRTLTAVDLNSNTVIGQPLDVGPATGVARAPSGLLYVTATNRVYEIDGRVLPLAVRNEIQLNARPTKLVFSFDGRVAVAANQTPATGSSFLLFDLIAKSLIGTFPNSAQIPVVDRLTVVGNNRVWGVSTQTQELFEISLSPFNVTIPDITSQIGNIRNIIATAASEEIPPRWGFVLTSSSAYRFDLGTSPHFLSGQVAVPPQQSNLVFGGPQTTGVPVSMIGFNDNQVAAPSATYLPLVVRVHDSFSRRLAGVIVTYTSDNPAAQILGASATTNSEGYAQTLVTAPTTTGQFKVTATVTGGAGTVKVDFTLTVSGGGGGGGGGGAQLVSIKSGNGQITFEQFQLNEPMVGVVRDALGNPVGGVAVTWQITNGQGTLNAFSNVGGALANLTCQGTTCTGTTDEKGETAVNFLASQVPPGFSYTQQTITLTVGGAAVSFIATTILSSLPGGGQAALPIVELIKPADDRTIIGQAGQTLQAAIQIRVSVVSGIQAGQPLPNIAMRITTGLDPNTQPTVRCAGGDPLTDSSGIATCDMVFGSRLGTAPLTINAGGVLNIGGTTVFVTIRPGPPSTIRIVQGNNQSGNPGQTLPLAFLGEIGDGFGNLLTGVAAQWEVGTAGSITLRNVVSTSDSFGRVSALGTLGSIAGTHSVRVRAGSATAEFRFTVNVTLSRLEKISGDGQVANINTPFPLALIVRLVDANGNGVPSNTITFQVVSGSGILSSSTATTNSQGQASVNVSAGNVAGPIVVNATVATLSASFNLTARLPGPVFTATSIVNTASGQVGVTPCGIATIFGTGFAPGLQGVLAANVIFGGALPYNFRNVEVFFDNIAAPIFALANENNQEQVIVHVPCNLAAPSTVSVMIRVSGGSTTVSGVQVARVQPGIFEVAVPAGQRRYAVAMRPDGSFVTLSNPARRGEIITFFVVGLGPVTPATDTNRAGIPGQNVLLPLIAGLNNEGVRLVSAKLLEGVIGVYAVQFEVPVDAAIGNYINLAIAVEVNPGQLVFGNGSVIAAVAP